jgi:acyl-CoA thioesterase
MNTMSAFDHDTLAQPAGELAWTGRISADWNIGANPNGGYLLAVAMAAMRQAVPAHPDPLTVTAHYLRPGLGGQPCTLEARVLRTGRQLSTLRGTLNQDDEPRLEILAALGDLGQGNTAIADLEPPAPAMPPPDDCIPRSAGEQGVTLSILDRLDVRLHPDQARAGSAGRARVSGWIRFADGRAPDPLGLLLFADAFPPAVFGLLGVVGWVPTVELTVHVRRRPAPGWVRASFDTVDLADGRLIEDGRLWDAEGRLVAQSRQLALVRPPAARRP